MDESRFGLHSVVRHCWGLRGQRVVKPFQQRFDWEYLYGAVDILSGEPVFCHLPTVSCETVWTFLRERVQTAPEAHHVVLWDGAKFHSPRPSGKRNGPVWPKSMCSSCRPTARSSIPRRKSGIRSKTPYATRSLEALRS